GPHRRDVGERRAGRAIRVVGQAAARAGAALDEYPMPVGDERGDPARGQRDTIFFRLDLARHADPHGAILWVRRDFTNVATHIYTSRARGRGSARTRSPMSRILDGKAVAQAVRAEAARDVAALAARGVVPGLATVLVGDDP